MDKPIIIIGAGIGGLSAAIRLAIAGRRVIIFEKNPAVGGKMSEYRAEGFRWDMGPSVITMRYVLEDLFAAANRKLDDYLSLLPIEPLTRYFYPDGIVFDASRDLPNMMQQIASIEPRDVAGYLAYLAYAARLHRVTGPVFIYDQPPGLRSLLRVPIGDMLHVDPLRTMDRAIRGFVRSPHLRQLLGRFATYVGASPYQAPATLNVIGHVEMNEGVWYPEGGIYSIARALERLAKELGIEIYTGSGVQKIMIDNGRVKGVMLADGKEVTADQIIANVDVATVYEHLLPTNVTSQAKRQQLIQQETSCSGFIILLGINKRHPQLAHHNIFFSGDYKREFDDIFRREIPPDEPTIYVSITAKTDSQDAPDGHENWFVLVNVPALSSKFDWKTQATIYRDRVLARLADFGLDIQSDIVHEHMLTPHDLEQLSGARRGALYGASSNNRLAAFRRPHNRSADIKGLYFAGGTTHPGGGVPMVMLSGKVAANLLIQDNCH